MRNNGFAEIITGPLKFRVNKNGNGFIDEIFFWIRKGIMVFQKMILFALSDLTDRGSFLDIFDDNGIDYSKANIIRTELEKRFGSFTI